MTGCRDPDQSGSAGLSHDSARGQHIDARDTRPKREREPRRSDQPRDWSAGSLGQRRSRLQSYCGRFFAVDMRPFTNRRRAAGRRGQVSLACRGRNDSQTFWMSAQELCHPKGSGTPGSPRPYLPIFNREPNVWSRRPLLLGYRMAVFATSARAKPPSVMAAALVPHGIFRREPVPTLYPGVVRRGPTGPGGSSTEAGRRPPLSGLDHRPILCAQGRVLALVLWMFCQPYRPARSVP